MRKKMKVFFALLCAAVMSTGTVFAAEVPETAEVPEAETEAVIEEQDAQQEAEAPAEEELPEIEEEIEEEEIIEEAEEEEVSKSAAAAVTSTVIASGNCGEGSDNVRWEICNNDGVLELHISGTGRMKEYETYTESAEYNYTDRDYTKGNTPWYSRRNSIKKVIVDGSVSTISTGAFANLTALTSVELGDGIRTIKDMAFANTGITGISIPDSVTEMGWGAFQMCGSIESIDLPAGISEIAPRVFWGCNNLSSVSIPENVRIIGQEAFSSCGSLSGVTVEGSNLSRIGKHAFEYDSSLKDLGFLTDGNVHTIEDYAFANCGIETFRIPYATTKIGPCAFYNCDSLKRITIPDCMGPRTICRKAFGACDNLTYVEVEARGAQLLVVDGGEIFSDPTPMIHWGDDDGEEHPTVYPHYENGLLIQCKMPKEECPVDFAAVSGRENVKVIYGILVDRLTFNMDTDKVVVGGTLPTNVDVQPGDACDKTIVWTSGDESIATVNSEGVITGVSEGTVEIFYEAVNSLYVRGSIEINVVKTIMMEDVAMDRVNDEIFKGKTCKINTTVSPASTSNKALTWKSSNTKVATVDATGKVTAVAAGTATITCTAKDGSGKSDSCTIKVILPVTGITLDKTSATVFLGTTTPLTLNATVVPSNATYRTLTWTSSNPYVAGVTGMGNIIPRTTGTTTITCTARDGSGVKATCIVTVAKPVSKITLSSTSVTLKRKATKKLTATVSPTSATNKAVTWKSSNTKVAKVDSTGKITAVAKGTATITCTAKDGSGVKATCKVTVK